MCKCTATQTGWREDQAVGRTLQDNVPDLVPSGIWEYQQLDMAVAAGAWWTRNRQISLEFERSRLKGHKHKLSRFCQRLSFRRDIMSVSFLTTSLSSFEGQGLVYEYVATLFSLGLFQARRAELGWQMVSTVA